MAKPVGPKNPADIIPIRGITYGSRGNPGPKLLIMPSFGQLLIDGDIPKGLRMNFRDGITVSVKHGLEQNMELFQGLVKSTKMWLGMNAFIGGIKKTFHEIGASRLEITIEKDSSNSIKLVFNGKSTHPKDPGIEHEVILSSVLLDERLAAAILPADLSGIQGLFYLFQDISISSDVAINPPILKKAVSAFISTIKQGRKHELFNHIVENAFGQFREQHTKSLKSFLDVRFLCKDKEVKVKIRGVVRIKGVEERDFKREIDKVFRVLTLPSLV